MLRGFAPSHLLTGYDRDAYKGKDQCNYSAYMGMTPCPRCRGCEVGRRRLVTVIKAHVRVSFTQYRHGKRYRIFEQMVRKHTLVTEQAPAAR